MTVHANGSAATTDTGPAKPHPLDPLTAAEIEAARDAVLHHFADDPSCDGKPPRFSFITLREPYGTGDPSAAPAPRRAEVVVHLPPTDPHVVLVDLSADTGAVQSATALPRGTQPVLTPADCELAETIVRADARVAALLRDRYDVADVGRLVCDPWSVHLADGVAVPGQRLVNTFLYVKAAAGDRGAHNHYASPLDVTPTVDLVTRSVVALHGAERAAPPRGADGTAYPSARVDYYDDALQYNAFGPTALRVNDPLKELRISQPAGPSFRLDGRVLTWQQWQLHIGFNHREGVVLNDVSFGGRSVLRRASLAEMAVPYADVHAPYTQKCAFDVGDYGLGYCANSLENGCDCLGEIRYLDATLVDAGGAPYVIRNAVCVHEEDAGLLHKHVEYRTGRSFARRARKLVVSFIATVVNYEYLFYWWLHVDGSIGLDIRLSGELSTNTLSASERATGQPHHGTLVAPGVNAQLHQHMFCARLDPAVDGPANRVVEVNAARAAGDAPGNAFSVQSTLLRTERDAQRDAAPGRAWRIESDRAVNRVSGKPTAYKLVAGGMAGAQPSLLTHDESAVSKRARFAQRAVWVTPRREAERFPAGEFPTQGVGAADTGLPEWTADGRDIVDTSLVVWHSFGITHLPRPEDFPIMPCETVGFALKPDSFFETNPALGICFSESGNGTVCHA